ncbi:MAG: ABC transporter permease subunit [Rhodopseudomonas palustris]|nr:ABC transporter permease subunit [Rhodopseudomonas palustris]
MKSKHLSIIAKKEFRGLFNERTILLAVLLQLFIALFSSFLMVGLTSMYDPSSLSKYSRSGTASPMPGMNRSYSTISRQARISASTRWTSRRLLQLLKSANWPLLSMCPIRSRMHRSRSRLRSIHSKMISRRAIVDVKLKDIFLKYEQDLREIRADRLKQEVVQLQIPKTSGGGDFYEFVYGLLIPLLVFMPAIIASALVIDLITEEYQHETLETLISTPVTFAEMVWGKVLACELLVPIQAGAWLVLLMINGIAIQNAGLILLQVIGHIAYPDPAWHPHCPALP